MDLPDYDNTSDTYLHTIMNSSSINQTTPLPQTNNTLSDNMLNTSMDLNNSLPTTTNKSWDNTPFSTTRPFHYQFSLTPLPIHALATTIFAILGLLGNCLVILVYSRHRKHYSGRVFVIALAILDILACLAVLPQFPLLERYATNGSWSTPEIRAIFVLLMADVLCYLWTLVVIALDRFWAVFFPMRYTASARRSTICIVVGYTVCIVVALVAQFETGSGDTTEFNVRRGAVGMVILLTFLLLIVLYPMIVIKIYYQGRKINRMLDNEETSNQQRNTCDGQKREIGTHDAQIPIVNGTEPSCSTSTDRRQGTRRAETQLRTKTTSGKVRIFTTRVSPLNTELGKNAITVPSNKQNDYVLSNNRGNVHSNRRRDNTLYSNQYDSVSSKCHHANVPSNRHNDNVPSNRHNDNVPSNRHNGNVPSNNQHGNIPSNRHNDNVPGNRHNDNVPSNRPRGNRRQRQRIQKRHMITMKMFLLVAMLYVISFVPMLLKLLNIVVNFHIMYIFFFNHIGNPVIYLLVNKRFRNDLKKLYYQIQSKFASCR